MYSLCVQVCCESGPCTQRWPVVCMGHVGQCNLLFVCLLVVYWSGSRTTSEEGGPSQSCGELLCFVIL